MHLSGTSIGVGTAASGAAGTSRMSGIAGGAGGVSAALFGRVAAAFSSFLRLSHLASARCA
jgi:hypothetical protein